MSSGAQLRRAKYKPMLQAFLDYIKYQHLIEKGKRSLLAISGGLDSMVMLHLFHQAGLECGVAHCNFSLRGDASDADEQLVVATAEKLSLPIYTKRFDTEKEAAKKGLSIQMAAREMRYNWFKTLLDKEQYDYIATAHHLNDNIETLFLNLAKGTGIRGLHGILPQNGPIIRPLLFATRAELEDYQQKHNIPYREDASNASDKYSRNRIRHHLIPVLKEINPSIESTMADNIGRFRDAEHFYDLAIQHIKDQAFTRKGKETVIDIKVLLQHKPALPSLLFELLTPYQIRSSQAQQLATSILTGHPGAMFYTPDYVILVDRSAILIRRKSKVGQNIFFTIEEANNQYLHLPDAILHIQHQEGKPKQYAPTNYTAYLDASSLHFPLTIRRWQAGDTFQPLGLGGHHQKVQDFFSNNKVSRFDKEQAWILEDAKGEICWLLGYRIGEGVKIKPDTKAYWALTLQAGAL
jgi:tRNA(Ile)-lysidine synthase